MRTPLALAAALLLLAGCTSPSPAAETVEEDAAGSDLDPAAGSTDGDAGSGAAAPGAATGVVDEAHAHDLWGAATRITRLDAQISVEASAAHHAYAEFPRLDGLVLEGTGVVEVLLSAPQRRACSILSVDDLQPCTPAVDDPAPSAVLQLEYRDAASTAWIPLGAVTWDAPMSILVEPQQVDMPHSSVSLWEFRALSEAYEDATTTFHAKVDIVRGDGEIPRWPGHPALYLPGEPEREVLRASGRTDRAPEDVVGGEWRGRGTVPVEGLVSFGTRTLIVLVNVTAVEGPPGAQPNGWNLEYRNAAGVWNATDDAEGDALRFVIPVGDADMDSPYLEASRWQILLTGDSRVRVPIGQIVGPAMSYAVEYDVVAIASALPPESYAQADPGAEGTAR